MNMVKRQNLWHVLYFEDENGHSEVFEFVNNRKQREKAKVLALLSTLEEQGPQLPRPYADILEDGVHELRIKLSGNQVRILYFFCFRDFIILTNIFVKNSQKVPSREIAKAKKCRGEFLNREKESELRKNIYENT